MLDAAGDRSPGTGGASFWADSAFIAAAGIPTVLFGPGGEGAHAAEEWVSLDDTAAVARLLAGVAEALCARQPRTSTPVRSAAPTTAAAGFHHALPDYAPTPVRDLPGGVLVKDESGRLGLPAFKILGASWAVERALNDAPATTTLVAASAGNHGRAVAHEAARRGLELPRVPAPALAGGAAGGDRRRGRRGRGGGGRLRGVRGAGRARRAARHGVLEIADVGESGPARDVIDGYATLFDEAARQARVRRAGGARRAWARWPPRRRASPPARGSRWWASSRWRPPA